MTSGRVLGFGLLGLSFISYASILAVPLSPLTIEGKIAVTSALVIGGEIAFWVGGILVGRELVSRYRQAFNPIWWAKWFRRRLEGGKNR